MFIIPTYLDDIIHLNNLKRVEVFELADENKYKTQNIYTYTQTHELEIKQKQHSKNIQKKRGKETKIV